MIAAVVVLARGSGTGAHARRGEGREHDNPFAPTKTTDRPRPRNEHGEKVRRKNPGHVHSTKKRGN